jgi:hypothetical protein
MLRLLATPNASIKKLARVSKSGIDSVDSHGRFTPWKFTPRARGGATNALQTFCERLEVSSLSQKAEHMGGLTVRIAFHLKEHRSDYSQPYLRREDTGQLTFPKFPQILLGNARRICCVTAMNWCL